MAQVNCRRFNGWTITCPYCLYIHYVDEDESDFHPTDGKQHIVKCEGCSQDIELKVWQFFEDKKHERGNKKHTK